MRMRHGAMSSYETRTDVFRIISLQKSVKQVPLAVETYLLLHDSDIESCAALKQPNPGKQIRNHLASACH